MSDRDSSRAVEFQTRTTCELRREDCGDCTEHWRKVVRLKDHETGLGEFDVVYCRLAKLGFTNPYPTEETSGYLYEDKDSADFDVIRDSFIDDIKDFLSRRQLRHLAPQRHVRAVLDYATGNGRFALSAKKVFPRARVDAVDYQSAPPPLLVQHADQATYFNLADFEKQDQLYDLIILRHVLEHTHHPVRFLEALGQRLTPEGVLYVEVPNLESACAKLFAKYWKNYYVPRHIYHYTIPSLAEIIRRAGLVAEIGRNEMPLMGNTISILTGANKSNVLVQGCGALLFPVQWMIEKLCRSSTCINARCRVAPGKAAS